MEKMVNVILTLFPTHKGDDHEEFFFFFLEGDHEEF